MIKGTEVALRHQGLSSREGSKVEMTFQGKGETGNKADEQETPHYNVRETRESEENRAE